MTQVAIPRSTGSIFRVFDSDGPLVGVAFMDIGVYVTLLRTLKTLVGDAVKIVIFVTFQVRSFNSHENVNLGSSSQQLFQIGRSI